MTIKNEDNDDIVKDFYVKDDEEIGATPLIMFCNQPLDPGWYPVEVIKIFHSYGASFDEVNANGRNALTILLTTQKHVVRGRPNIGAGDVFFFNVVKLCLDHTSIESI